MFLSLYIKKKKFNLVFIIFACISHHPCFSINMSVAPVFDEQRAPLVAIVDTNKIGKQLLESLAEPVSQLINGTITERLHDVEQRLTECENKYGHRLNVIEQKLNGK